MPGPRSNPPRRRSTASPSPPRRCSADDAARATSPNFTAAQGYKGKSPPGVGPIPNVKGSDGSGMSYADVEYEWTLKHEDLGILSLRVLEPLPPDLAYGPDHGTAVLGILSGIPNNFGVTGIAPMARPYVAAASTLELGYQPARAIGLAMTKLKAGDVLIIEQHSPVCGLEDYGPLEYYQDVFDAISAATAKGIIVVAAAGNGDVNLDRGHLLRRLRPHQAQLASHHRRRRLVGQPDQAGLLQLRLARRCAGLGRERHHHRLWRRLQSGQ